ncbi:MAG: condensation domain-containing protein, partial [Cyanobacteria bacterium P01_H01_bin.15]
IDLSKLSTDDQRRALANHAQRLQTSLDFVVGPVLEVCAFDLGKARSAQLMIVVHHLVIDGVSWRILLEDLQQAYSQAILALPIQLAAKTHSYQQWAIALTELANSAEMAVDADYWQGVAQIPSLLPIDSPEARSCEPVKITLSPAETQALLLAGTVENAASITALLLTALVQTMMSQTEQSGLLVDLESHGRFSENLDLSRTVGWFTALYPVYLTLNANELPLERVQTIHGQVQQTPHNGLSYGVLRYLKKREELASQAPVSFNYLGQLNVIATTDFQRLPVLAPNVAPDHRPAHPLEINAWIEHEQLTVDWSFDPKLRSRQGTMQLAEVYGEQLKQLLQAIETENTSSSTSHDRTASEFDLVELDDNELDAVLGQISFFDQQEVSS